MALYEHDRDGERFTLTVWTTAHRPCVVDGRRRREGEEFPVRYYNAPVVPDEQLVDEEINARIGDGGPLGWGGLTARKIRAAIRAAIIRTQRDLESA